MASFLSNFKRSAWSLIQILMGPTSVLVSLEGDRLAELETTTAALRCVASCKRSIALGVPCQASSALRRFCHLPPGVRILDPSRNPPQKPAFAKTLVTQKMCSLAASVAPRTCQGTLVPTHPSHTPRLGATGFDDLALRAAIEDPNFPAGTSAKREEALGLNPYNSQCRFQESMNKATNKT